MGKTGKRPRQDVTPPPRRLVILALQLRPLSSLCPAASILYLEGAELSVLQLNTNERLCVKFEFLSTLKHHHKRVRLQPGRWGGRAGMVVTVGSRTRTRTHTHTHTHF